MEMMCIRMATLPFSAQMVTQPCEAEKYADDSRSVFRSGRRTDKALPHAVRKQLRRSRLLRSVETADLRDFDAEVTMISRVPGGITSISGTSELLSKIDEGAI